MAIAQTEAPYSIKIWKGNRNRMFLPIPPCAFMSLTLCHSFSVAWEAMPQHQVYNNCSAIILTVYSMIPKSAKDSDLALKL